MTSELESLRVGYETLGMTPEQLAEDRKLDIAAVKAGLMQCSVQYRTDCRKEPENESRLNFSEDEQWRIKQELLNLALGSEDEHLKFKALVYCRDDAKGRKDVVKQVPSMQMNVLMFNQMMQKTRSVADGVKAKLLGSASGSEPISV